MHGYIQSENLGRVSCFLEILTSKHLKKFTIIFGGNIIHMNNAFEKLEGVRGPLYM